MEVLEGIELLDFLNQFIDKNISELPDSQLRYIFLKIGDSINQLHKAGVAHRDIKLQNMMITQDYDIKLIDFGFGCQLSGKKGNGFMKTNLGTPMYKAPEVI